MIYIALIYCWLVLGTAAWAITPLRDGLSFVLCILFGGFLVPGRAIAGLAIRLSQEGSKDGG